MRTNGDKTGSKQSKKNLLQPKTMHIQPKKIVRGCSKSENKFVTKILLTNTKRETNYVK